MKRVIFALIGILITGFTVIHFTTIKKEIVAASKPKVDSSSIPVMVEAVKRQTINSDFTYIGTFMPNKEVPIAAEGQGKIIKILVKEGDYVKQGQVLAYLDNDMLKLKLKAEEAAVETQRAAAQTAQNGVETAQNRRKCSKICLSFCSSGIAKMQLQWSIKRKQM